MSHAAMCLSSNCLGLTALTSLLIDPCAIQEQSKSWALNTPQSEFTVAAVYSQASDRYYTVLQGKQGSASTSQTLLSWPATVTHGSLEQTAQRTPLQGSVHSIHAVPVANHHTANSQPADLVIVYTDGTAVFGDTEVQQPAKTAGKRVLHANMDGNMLAVCSTNAGLAYTLELYSLQVI